MIVKNYCFSSSLFPFIYSSTIYIHIYIYVLDFSLLLLLSCASQSLITALLRFLRATSHLQRSLLIYLLLFRSVTLIPTVLCFPLFFLLLFNCTLATSLIFLLHAFFFSPSSFSLLSSSEYRL